jgi:SH3-like domain-containing protein
MRRFAPAWLIVRMLMFSAAGFAPLSVMAQSGTLRPPQSGPASQPGKPATAPGSPVRQAKQPAHATPVVQPHGAIHPAKPPEQAPPHLSLPLPPPAPPSASGAAAPTTATPTPPVPAKPAEEEKPAGTGLTLPRFASLRSDDVNLRAGPGFRYPIEWVYKRRNLPMEIEREFEVWRLVQAPDGIRGWVHQATLTGLRTFMVQGADATLRAEPKDDASPVALLKVGVIGRIRSCEVGSAWCRLQVGDYRGYLKRSQFWGALPDEVITP